MELKSFATKSVSYIDESLLSISTGYGKIVRESNTVFGYNYCIEAEDDVVKESTPIVVSALLGLIKIFSYLQMTTIRSLIIFLKWTI